MCRRIQTQLCICLPNTSQLNHLIYKNSKINLFYLKTENQINLLLLSSKGNNTQLLINIMHMLNESMFTLRNLAHSEAFRVVNLKYFCIFCYLRHTGRRKVYQQCAFRNWVAKMRWGRLNTCLKFQVSIFKTVESSSLHMTLENPAQSLKIMAILKTCHAYLHYMRMIS